MPDTFEMPSWFHEPTGIARAKDQDNGRAEGSIWCLSYYRDKVMYNDFVWVLKLGRHNYRFFSRGGARGGVPSPQRSGASNERAAG